MSSTRVAPPRSAAATSASVTCVNEASMTRSLAAHRSPPPAQFSFIASFAIGVTVASAGGSFSR
jgi:hypothetical protein